MSQTVAVIHSADRPDLVEASVEMVWSEWGQGQPPEERQRWLDIALRDRNRDGVPTGFFALGEHRSLLGVVGLHEFDIEARRDRSPWLCGLFVRADVRGHGIGHRLVQRLEDFATKSRISRVWVFTDRAPGFYRSCGWTEVERLPAERDHGPGVLFMRDRLSGYVE
ncbi:MAG: GNAT family N-acetyltransferase [Candidatus Dormiibacterota bacterium]